MSSRPTVDIKMLRHQVKHGVTIYLPADRAKKLLDYIDALESTNEDEPAYLDKRRLWVSSTLTRLVEKLTTKPLTNWQRNQLRRWDEQIAEDPPTYTVQLRPCVSKEQREKQHQLKRIAEVCSVTSMKARVLYNRGMRIIEQED